MEFIVGLEEKFANMTEIERASYRMLQTGMTDDKLVDVSRDEKVYKVDTNELLLLIVRTLDRVAIALESNNKWSK